MHAQTVLDAVKLSTHNTPFSPGSLSMRSLATCCGASYGSRPLRWSSSYYGQWSYQTSPAARVRMRGGEVSSRVRRMSGCSPRGGRIAPLLDLTPNRRSASSSHCSSQQGRLLFIRSPRGQLLAHVLYSRNIKIYCNKMFSQTFHNSWTHYSTYAHIK